jgi:hypothetical protein
MAAAGCHAHNTIKIYIKAIVRHIHVTARKGIGTSTTISLAYNLFSRKGHFLGACR